MTKLADDVVIDEIREIRHRISERVDHDLGNLRSTTRSWTTSIATA